MVRLTLTHDLDQLHQDLVEMATRAETAIEESIQALNRQDAALARSVIAGDDVVDELERAIEHRCLNILARHQPLARDLRAVSAALKVITDLERISDGATDIGEIVLRLADVYKRQARGHCLAGQIRRRAGASVRFQL